MFKKTLCLIALASVAFSQDVTSQQVNDAINQAAQAAQTTTVGQAVAQAQAAANNGDANQILDSVPALNSLTVGYGNREVVVTPQAADPSLNDWLQGQANVAREDANWADGEWALQWSVENGDDYALLHNNNNDFVIVDTTTKTNNNWGANDALDAEIGHGAEQLVNYVYDNEVNLVDGASITAWLSNVLNNDNVNNFLQNNNDKTVADAANQVANNNPQAVDAVNQAAANLNNQDVGGVIAGAANAVQNGDVNQAQTDIQNAVGDQGSNIVNQVQNGVQDVLNGQVPDAANQATNGQASDIVNQVANGQVPDVNQVQSDVQNAVDAVASDAQAAN